MRFSSLGEVQAHLKAGGQMVDVVDAFLERIQATSHLNIF